MNFTELKELITEAREEAKREALRVLPCVRSRGAWLSVSNANNETITESDVHDITTLARLRADIAYFKTLGGVEFRADGGFDGAESVRDLNDLNHDPWISEWDVLIDEDI